MHPRVELHVHLDGAIQIPSLLRIAVRRRLVLPGVGAVPSSEDDIWTALRTVPPEEPWRMFDLVNEIIGGDEATLSEVAHEFVGRQAAQSVAYTEVRWDPVRPAVSHLANASISVEAAVHAVEAGLRAGAEEHGVEAHQILCAMRGSPEAACFELARLAAATRNGAMGGVVGIDLAGDEYNFNNSQNNVEGCFQYAKQELLLNTTVHAGESYTDMSRTWHDIRSAVEVRSAGLEARRWGGATAPISVPGPASALPRVAASRDGPLWRQVMGVDRIGHGYAATQDEGTLQLLLERRVPVESCPGGSPDFTRDINLNATRTYKERGVRFGISTDDPARARPRRCQEPPCPWPQHTPARGSSRSLTFRPSTWTRWRRSCARGSASPTTTSRRPTPTPRPPPLPRTPHAWPARRRRAPQARCTRASSCWAASSCWCSRC